ncbi:hypothetical protein [Glycomyces harbinensis]|nr:hypothetical protein [Glycomyces harbinensis]
MNSVFKGNVRKASALLAGFAMATTLTGLAVAGTASAAPAVAETETTSSASGDYTIQAILFGTYRLYSNCAREQRELQADPDLNIVAWCESAKDSSGRTVWKLWYQYGL